MKKVIVFAVCFTLFLSFVFVAGQSVDDLGSKIKILVAIVETIIRSYVDETEPKQLVNNAIDGVLGGLDPHSIYLPANTFEKWNGYFEGFSGIGVRYDIIDDKAVVLEVFEGGPAQRAGLKFGDRIASINTEHVSKLKKRNQIAQMLTGASESRVEITVEREEWPAPRRFILTRNHVQVNSIPLYGIIQGEIGYIKIDNFTTSTSDELDQALRQLTAEGMEKLILDLRGNSGGYMSAAVEVIDNFLPKGKMGGKMIVYTKGRTASSYQEYTSEDDDNDFLKPLIVMIDHGTASASEIVAGSLQDWDRALIAGKSSFGKGLVQSQYRFQDGSALLLTTSRYYLPSGRTIQRDYKGRSKNEYYQEAYDKDVQRGEWFRTSTGRSVCGGCGITPDIELKPNEEVSVAVRKLVCQQSLLNELIVNQAQTLKDSLSKPDVFIRSYSTPTRLIRKAFSNADIQATATDVNQVRSLVKRKLARRWTNGELGVLMEIDQELQKALELFPRINSILQGSGLTSKLPPLLQQSSIGEKLVLKWKQTRMISGPTVTCEDVLEINDGEELPDEMKSIILIRNVPAGETTGIDQEAVRSALKRFNVELNLLQPKILRVVTAESNVAKIEIPSEMN